MNMNEFITDRTETNWNSKYEILGLSDPSEKPHFFVSLGIAEVSYES